MAPFGDAVGLVARSELRSRWRALLGLALLVAFVGAVSLAGFAGARRTASALDRFETATLARDVRVVGVDDETTHELAEDLEDQPWVTAVGEFVDFSVNPDEAVAPVVGSVTGDLLLSVYAGVDDRFGDEVDRPLVLDGRMPSGDDPDEIAIDEVTQQTLDLEVGDAIPVTTFDAADLDCFVSNECPFQGLPGPAVDLEVVGVVRDVDAFAASEDPTPTATASAAFTDAYRDEIGSFRSEVAVRLQGEDALDQLQSFMDERPGTGSIITPADDYAAGAGEAVDVLGTSLLVFAIISGLAGAFAVLQAVSRQVEGAVAATRVLPSLGFSRWRWALAASLPTIGAVALGALIAPIGAALASGLFPFGGADRIEPDPGLRIDLPVLLGGAALSALVIAAFAVVLGRRRCSRAADVKGWTPVWPWAGVTLAGGARLAFGRGRSRAAGPMRSAMIGIGVGALGVVAAATVLLSLDHVVDDPARWGWTWSVSAQTLDPAELDATVAEVAEQDDVEAASIVQQGLVQSGQDEIGAYAFEPVEGELTSPVRRGRLPEADDEVAVGEFELSRRDLDLGDTFTVIDPDGEERDFDIVGSVVAPTFNDLRPAQGTVFTVDGLDEVTLADPIRIALLRYAPGVDPAEKAVEFQDLTLGVLGPITPPQLASLDDASVVVVGLITFFAALALVGLLQALALSTRRHRGNLAVWRTLGFVPSEVRRAVLWQSVLVTAVGVLVGVPLGLYAGRVAWRLTIQSVGVLDDPTYPVLLVAIALPAAVVVAVVFGLLPAVAGRPR